MVGAHKMGSQDSGGYYRKRPPTLTWPWSLKVSGGEGQGFLRCEMGEGGRRDTPDK